VVEGGVMVELKAHQTCSSDDEAQVFNELQAATHTLDGLINFGRDDVKVKRMAYKIPQINRCYSVCICG